MNDDSVGGRARLTQERSRVRREQLITAASKLFTEGGTKAITHRSVSELADVPLATVSYYFDSIDQLVEVLFSETLSSWSAMWDELTVPEGSRLSSAEIGTRFADLLRQADPEGYAHELRVYLSTLARPPLLAQVHEMQGHALEAVVSLLRSAGVEDVWSAAPHLVMTFAGALVSITDPGTDPAFMAGQLESLVALIVESAVARESSPG